MHNDAIARTFQRDIIDFIRACVCVFGIIPRCTRLDVDGIATRRGHWWLANEINLIRARIV